ncbi:Ig-like domain-containing protein [candidate division KSB1 bacterium]|nr:Ig-like domain-containing protein [candidate division KSB1 bacterium]
MTSIEITPDSVRVLGGKTQQFICTAKYSDESSIIMTENVNWSVSPGTAGRIDSTGHYTAFDTSGIEIVTAMYLDKQAESIVIQTDQSSIADIDGNIYKIVQIGDQWWLAENLKVTHYRNGEAITHVTDWSNLTAGAYCAYKNDENNADTYGYLYDWAAVKDSRNIAPEGWHVPTDEEWKQLEMYLGMSQFEADDIFYRGTNEGSKLADNASLWSDGALKNNSVFGESGFSALPGGCHHFTGNFFGGMGFSAYFWSSTSAHSLNAWGRKLYDRNSEVYRYSTSIQDESSVRLVRD